MIDLKEPKEPPSARRLWHLIGEVKELRAVNRLLWKALACVTGLTCWSLIAHVLRGCS